MILVSAFELIPMAHRYRRPGWFIAGTTLSLVVYRVLALVIGVSL